MLFSCFYFLLEKISSIEMTNVSYSENLAFNTSSFPKSLVDGKLDNPTNATPSTVQVLLYRKAVISEVFVSVGNVSNQTKLYLYLGSVLTTCESPQEISSFVCVVFYCKNQTYFEKNVRVEARFGSQQGTIEYREVAVFGQSCK